MATQRIHKYGLTFEQAQVVSMPKRARIISAAAVNNWPVIYAVVDPDAERILREVYVQGTNEPFEFDMSTTTFLGSLTFPPADPLSEAMQVWHVFIANLPMPDEET